MCQKNLTQNKMNNQDDFRVEIHSEVFNQDYDEIGFEPKEVDTSDDYNPYEITE